MSLHEDEWQKAQNLKISMDLITEAKSQLEFLAQVDAHPRLFDRTVLERAIERYEYCWLPLVATTSGSRTQLIPPLDCAWVWHCHRLNPVQYAEDCNRLFGIIVDAALLSKHDTNEFTMEVWKIHYPEEPYTLDLYGNMTTKYSGRPRSITYNLVEAVARQKTFYYQVSEPHYLEESFLAAAGKRYKGFLHLIGTHGVNEKSPKFFVPTYDIDLMWHAHQLSPICYHKDTSQILGRILDHDDRDSNRNLGAKLDLGFTQTCTFWENMYGTPYEKAGCMFRGEPPPPILQPEAINSNKLVTLAESSGEWVDSQKRHLSSRSVTKVHVHLAVRGAKASKRSLRLRALKKFEALKLDAPASSDPQWKHVWTFESEVSTEGMVFELRSQRQGIISKVLGLKKLDEMAITWKMVLDSDTQSVRCRFPLAAKKEPSASLPEVFISVTPPVVGPYLLRSVRARPTGDDKATVTSILKGLWITRTVLDHTHNEVYVIRSRCNVQLQEAEKVVHVHLGGWEYKGSSNDGRVPGIIAGSAKQIVDPSTSVSDCRSWSLLDGSVVLTLRQDGAWNLRPQVDVHGRSQPAITLFPGRRLQFAVADSSHDEELGFVTLVRCTRDAPLGTATALFSWKTGAMQINHEENVVLVLLLSTIIGMSMSELLGKKIEFDTTSRRRRDHEDSDDWGGFTSSSLDRTMELWDLFQGSSTGGECSGGNCGIENGCGASGGDAGGGAAFVCQWDYGGYGGGGCGGGCGGGTCGGGGGGGGGDGGGCGGGGCGGGGCGGG